MVGGVDRLSCQRSNVRQRTWIAATAINRGSRRTAVRRSPVDGCQRHISRREMQGVHKNDTTGCVYKSFTARSAFPHSASPAGNLRRRVHKNETQARPRSPVFSRGDGQSRTPHRRHIEKRASGCSRASVEDANAAPTFRMQRSNDLRAHRTLIVSLILSLALVGRRAPAQAPDHRRLDIDPAAGPETRDRLPQGVPQDPAPKVGGGQSDIGISDVAARTRSTSATPRATRSKRGPKGLVGSQRSPATASA